VSSNLNLVLLGLEYSADESKATYTLESEGATAIFSALANDAGGIRGVEVPEDFNTFLWKYLQVDARVVERLVRATWETVDGHPPQMPLELISRGSSSV
jgi:hypothetical protein